ncbi:hypothetical protein AXQ97_003103 [Salmonella enterica subsp. enterica]|jgi:hypothetical protein|uniref:Uncharacterized protein n=1 Tax=Citrobacter werkmanii TaxID=67827 RepID=A0A9N8CPY1_9ENTR|nr:MULTISPECIES: hypothetical protein [Citrobacter freundii complex]ECC3678858.1 hypothetical protein [Salmonella enterica subsp. enterica serovar Miami]HEA3642930.1 hypothetical protein [Escherichia coli]EEI9131284.1 hypothetical protein [Salmonella enterica subsp. enterica serovar Miami]EEJ1577318.1 hypothetical protein [Salmonella enterica subsp. enterica serovar Miami]EEJ2837512.1 hypothetical protein [Salmonella enterica subsp. enterica serovar Miami]
MLTPKKQITVVTLDKGSDTETEVEIRSIVDCSVLPPPGRSPACAQLARWFAEKVAAGQKFRLCNAPDALIKEFRRAAERRGVKVSAGMPRNEYGEVIGVSHIELKLKEANQ